MPEFFFVKAKDHLSKLIYCKYSVNDARFHCDEALKLIPLGDAYIDLKIQIIEIQFIINGGDWVKEWAKIEELALKIMFS
jgi:hypothetical protein